MLKRCFPHLKEFYLINYMIILLLKVLRRVRLLTAMLTMVISQKTKLQISTIEHRNNVFNEY